MKKTTILSRTPVTHDVSHFRLARPDGFDYVPGDATELALDSSDWRDETRPFTMTSLPDEPTLEFTIKRYDSHDGVTHRLHESSVGDSLLIADPFETFRDKGKGVFIAGGAGITPFLALMRDLDRKGRLEGYSLIFANKTEDDIICRAELDGFKGLSVTHVLSEQEAAGMAHGVVDRTLIEKVVPDLEQNFYLCGPPPMMKAVKSALNDLDVSPDAVSLDG